MPDLLPGEDAEFYREGMLALLRSPWAGPAAPYIRMQACKDLGHPTPRADDPPGTQCIGKCKKYVDVPSKHV